ncbi:hypothetical protein [Hyalangium rubrum]|uniref:50S ribosomal protein L7/L12 n=1 Tax=Hyalangium rubrum TaxID=3103134 RepID=A0ABU5GVG6_9BACT|nr:hypothetical protein [Hyalangium sp. s54d21]MDY7224859.1 hypothetical protein [Hyalangium sp. s54d21]
MDIPNWVEAIFRGPWLCIAIAAGVTLFILFSDGGGKAQRSEKEAQALKNVPQSAVKQARKLVQENTPLLAVKLLNEVAGISNVDAHAYVQTFQAIQEGHLSFGEALTVELACDVKAHMDKSEREQAVKLLVSRAGAPQEEAVRLVEMLGASSRSNRARVAGKPLPEAASAEDLKKVDALAAEGKAIEAIKLYRQLTGASLKEAKDYVDSRSAR